MEDPIPIINMLIHRITLLPHSRLNPDKEFGRKIGERDLAKRMKDKFKIVKNPRRYSIYNITDPVVKVVAQILAGKIMGKCHMDEVLTPIVSLVTWCMEGIQFN